MAKNAGWGRRDMTPPIGYDDYDAAAVAAGYAAPPGPAESKRDKRRREMVDRVNRLHADTLERRERIFHDLSEIFARTADELLPPPVFPTFDLSIPVGQLPPSLPFTDPVIPDMHPTPYLFALHRLSMQRANYLLSLRLYHDHQVGVARRLFEAEVERIEDEYESASKGIVDKLLEGVEERKKRLIEEKDAEQLSLDAFLDAQPRSHGTRRMRGNQAAGGARSAAMNGAFGGAGPGSVMGNNNGNGSGSQTGSVPPPDLAGDRLDPLTAHSILGLNGVSDPFHLGSALHPSNGGPLLSSLAGAGPAASLLTGGVGGTKRKPARTQPGLPPAHFLVQSGSYNQFGKSLAGLSSLRGEEVEHDIGECKRKRQRVATGRSRRQLD